MRRVVYENLARRRRQRRLQSFVVHFVSTDSRVVVRYVHSHRDGFGAEDLGVADVPRKEGFEEDTLVPGGERGLHRGVHRLRSRGGHQDVGAVRADRVGAARGAVVPRDGLYELSAPGYHGVLVVPRVRFVEQSSARLFPGGHVRAEVRPSLAEVEDARELGERGDLRPDLAGALVGLLAPHGVAEEASGVLVRHGGGARDDG
mmetsp:Transcript_10824/g.30242  ORF Transcript_10824/g.30242 Transcript_10824/m.30242 type:complete len:203 (-) Transcript_10824:196-804(-)